MSVLERLRAGTIVASLVSFPFILPHVVEDFAEGITGRVGLPTGPGAFLLGGFLALQSLGLVLVGRGGRGGFVDTFWVAVIWVAGALVDHEPALLAGRFLVLIASAAVLRRSGRSEVAETHDAYKPFSQSRSRPSIFQ